MKNSIPGGNQVLISALLKKKARGFTILSQHDSNSDGKITETDAVWDGLLVWRDINSNGYSESSELQSLSAYNIVSVNLFANAVSQFNQGNFVSHTGTYTIDTGSGLVNRAVHDVWFTYDNADSQFVGDYTLDPRAIFLPDLRGTGSVADLRVAMSMDNDGPGNLLDMVDQLSQRDFSSIFEGTNDVLNTVRSIMFRWTGVDDTDPQSRGIYVDAQELECVENMLGTSFLQRDIYTTPYYYASQFVDQAFILLQNNIYARLLAQGAGGELFTGNWKHDIASSTFTGITGLNAAKLAELQTEATGLADTEARGIFWANVVRMVEFTVGTANLNTTHRNALANAISGSDPALNLAEVVTSLSGAGIVGVNVQGTTGNDTISGGAGDDTLDGLAGNDTINGLDGRDRLNGRDGNDTLNGGAEDDLLSGGTGNDRYVYNLGDGNDVIVDEGIGAGNDDDRIVFGNGITLADLTFTRFGSTDLNIQIDVGGQISSINIERQFNAGGGAIEKIEFSDSSIYELEIQELQVHGLETGDVLYGVVTGASQNDTIFGHGGNDTIYAYGGDDTISGGAGSDTIQGGDGLDTAVWETDSTDFIIYRDNANYIVVQDTGDTSSAGFGADKIYNDVEFIAFNDITIDLNTTTFVLNDIAWGTPASISGTTASDILNGYLAHDTIHGLAGNDTISGHKGNDNIFGEAGNDALYGGEGNDLLSGGDQNDTLYDDAGNDTFDGGSGIDTLNYGSATAGVTVDLSITAVQDTGGAGIDTISGVENLTGSGFDDILTGDANANLIIGGAGDDTVDGGAGNDTVQGGAGNDTISGGDGTDLLTYASIAGGVVVDLSVLSSQNTGSAGVDTLSGFENMTGSGFADILRGDDNGNTIDAGAGDDIVEGRSGNDVLIGGTGVDTLTYASAVAGVTANLTLTSGQNTVGAGTDTVSGFENLTGSAFNDTLTGNSANNVIEGGEGNDILNGSTGTDTLSYATASAGVTVSLAITSAQDTGGAGIDTVSNFENLVGSVFDDVLIGSAGVNSIDGGAGNDVLQGGLGSDIALIGGSGIDTASWSVNSTNFIIYRDNADYITVRDTGASGYGFDRVYNDVEFVSFNDVTLNLATTPFILNGAGWGTSATLVGTSGNNTLSGTAARDIIFGGAGNDTLTGNQGDDDLYGESGVDTVSYAGALAGVTVNLSITSAQNTGSSGIDTLAGFENLTGSSFNDTLIGDASGNIINGGIGNDLIEGGAGNDTMIGGGDTDTLSYANATSAVNVNLSLTTAQDTGGSGIDTVSSFENLIGSSFNDTLTASSGANRIDGGSGNDMIIGGAGNDTIIGGGGDDIMTGEAGADTLSYASATAGVIVDLSITTAQDTSGAGIDTVSGFENLTGSAFNDILSGDVAGNVIDGGSGDDIIEGRSGNDTLIGGIGTDTLTYTNATVAVTVNLALATAQNTGGGGMDTISGFENLTGSAFNDTLMGSASANIIDGGAGIDTVSYATATSGSVVDLSGGPADDTLLNIENVTGSAFNDTITGDSSANIFRLGAGNDVVNGGGGIDAIDYSAVATAMNVSLVTGIATGEGNDTISNIENIVTDGGADVIRGNDSANILNSGAGNDTLSGGGGLDTLDGGAGTDTVDYSVAAAGVIVNLLTGSASNDGDGNSDVLLNIENVIGSSFNDNISGNSSVNVLSGGAGDDFISGGLASDTLDGGTGIDTVDYSSSASAVTVNLSAGTGTGQGTDALSSFENVIGSAFNDTITGTSGDNVLSSGAGNDLLKGSTGNDTLDGGSDIDTVEFTTTSSVTVNLSTGTASGEGTDTLANIENVTTDGGNDTLIGNSSNNAFNSGAGDDVLAGGAGNDTLNGAGGIDTATYAAALAGVTANLTTGLVSDDGDGGSDTLLNIENISGSVFNDNIIGSSSANVIDGGAGNDAISAGGGNDTISGGIGNDTLNGEGGTDTVSYSGAASSVTIDLSTGIVSNDGDGGSDTLLNIENVTGSAYNDTIIGSSVVNVLDGGAGNDMIAGGSGNDTLTGGEGDDTIEGGTGSDTLAGGNGIDTLTYVNATVGVAINLALTSGQSNGAIGTDAVSGFENLVGSAFNDTLTGSSAANIIEGGAGNDIMNGNSGADTLSYATATAGVTVDLSISSAQNTGGAGTDTISNFENLTGSSFGDILTGDVNGNVIDGGVGNDIIEGRAGNDILTGGLGTDTLSYASASASITASLAVTTAQNTNGAGTDTLSGFENMIGSAFDDDLTGSSAANVISGGSGNDVLRSSAGNDNLDGGSGSDTANYNAAISGVIIDILAGSASNDGDGGSDTLTSIENVIGSGFDDTISGDDTANQLTGGAGNDALSGGVGNDTFFYYAGDGSDTIEDNGGIDSIMMGGGILESDLEFSRDGNNLIITVAGNDTITISNHLVSGANYGVETLVLADNTVIDLTALSFDSAIYGTEENDVLTGTAENDVIYGYGGNDTVSGGAGDDVMDGGSGIDTLVYSSASAGVTVNLSLAAAQSTGSAGSDTISAFENLIGSAFDDVLTGSAVDNALTGGVGSDILVGGAGNDSYFYYTGNGSDTIEESQGVDAIVMGPGIIESDLDFSQDGDNLVITIGGVSAITVTNHFASGGDYTVESLVLDDETIIDLTDISFDEIILGTSGNDSLTGASGNDTIIGGAGNDTLQGGSGNDGYIFNTGDGQDIISDTEGSSDSIIFGAGIRADQLGFSFTGASNLEITFVNSSGDKLTITNQRNEGLNQRIENLVFDSGLILNLADINTWIIQGINISTFHARGSDGNDVIYAGGGPNILEGGEGDDVLVGDGLLSNGRPDIFIGGIGNDYLLGGGDNGDALGQDVFVYTSGMDTIDNPAQGLDVIRFENGIVWRDQHFTGKSFCQIATENSCSEAQVGKLIQQSFEIA